MGRPKSELSDSHCHRFYQPLGSDFTDPLGYLHARMEGTCEYTLLLFLPARALHDLWMPDARQGIPLNISRELLQGSPGT